MAIVSRRIARAALAVWFAASLNGAANLSRVSINQVYTDLPAIRVYADIRTEKDGRSEALKPDTVQLAVEGKPATFIGLKPFSEANEGTAYVFLVDISKSVSPASFKAVQESILAFVEKMIPADQAAILSFGDRVQTVSPLTGDRNSLKAAVTGLAATAPKTQLHLALAEGLRLARRRDVNLPKHRVIVVLSDGKDEGSGITAEDVLHMNEADRIPVYAIGQSNLPQSERDRFLEVLQRFSVLSGGLYFESEPGKVQQAYNQIHDRVTQVWVGEFTCPDCAADDRAHSIRLRASVGGQSLDDQATVTMTRITPAPPKPPVKLPWWRRLDWRAYSAAGLLLAVLLATGIYFVRRAKKEVPAPPPPPPAAAEESLTTPGIPMPQHEDSPLLTGRPGIELEFIPRDFRDTTGRISARLVDRLILGRAADAGVRFSHPQVSGKHCSIEVVQGMVLVTDLESTHGTAVNGVPIVARHKLESGDLLRLGPVEYRVNF